MLTTAEIVRSVYGAWRLAHADPRGMAYFDATEEGFWRSFRVAVLVAPLYALLVLLSYGPPVEAMPAEATASEARAIAVELIAYAIGWMAYPLAVSFLATVLDRAREYVGYIVAYNWAQVLVVPYQLALLVIIRAGAELPVVVLHLVVLAAWLVPLVYAWFIARTALKTSSLVAAGLVAVDLLISFLLVLVRNAMIY